MLDGKTLPISLKYILYMRYHGIALAHRMTDAVNDGFTERFDNQNFNVVVAKCCYSGQEESDKSSTCLVTNHNPGQDDRIHCCLLNSMSTVQAEEIRLPPSCLCVIQI